MELTKRIVSTQKQIVGLEKYQAYRLALLNMIVIQMPISQLDEVGRIILVFNFSKVSECCPQCMYVKKSPQFLCLEYTFDVYPLCLRLWFLPLFLYCSFLNAFLLKAIIWHDICLFFICF